jgi:CSLREA domain-containing protein
MRIACVLAALCLSGVPGEAGAAIFTVNSTADATDGACGPGAGECTLREAIEAAVATAGRDTIVFDPGVFVLGTITPIELTSALPLVADAAGTVIDGSGSSVAINGVGSFTGLVFASPPGVPLKDVSVLRLRLFNFSSHSLHICGGGPPSCDGDVSGALVRSVNAFASPGDGIRIEGRNVSKAQVVDSVAFANGASGIAVVGSQSAVGTRVEGCTARSNNSSGIVLDGGSENEAPAIVDSAAFHNVGAGFEVLATEVAKAKLTNVFALGNESDGIRVSAEESARATAITSSVASQNVSAGIAIQTSLGNAATSLQDAELDLNQFTGLYVGGPTAGIKIKRVAAIENGDGGLTLSDASTKARISDVVAVANNTGLYLATAGGKVKRILGGGNAQSTLFFLGTRSKLTKSYALGDEYSGFIANDGATGNVLRKNVALGNDSFDLNDANAGCANTWASNVFRIASDPCIH